MLMIIRLVLTFCRSTIVHSDIIPPKEQHSNAFITKDRQFKEDLCNSHSKFGDGIPGNLSRTSQAPQRIPQGNLEFCLK